MLRTFRRLLFARDAREARAAWAGWSPRTITHAWHFHHDVLAERLWETPASRIQMIIDGKPFREVHTRLKLFRPVDLSGTGWFAYFYAEPGDPNPPRKLEELHRQQCRPDCPWDGETIFP